VAHSPCPHGIHLGAWPLVFGLIRWGVSPDPSGYKEPDAGLMRQLSAVFGITAPLEHGGH
jgi:hypothetical protein